MRQNINLLAGISLVVTLTPLASAQVEARPSFPAAGFYEGVRVSAETGDEDGLRLKLTYAAGTPTIRFWVCEGECLPWPTHGLLIAGDKIEFIADDETILPGGKLQSQPRRFHGSFKAGQLSLSSPGYWKSQRLKLHPPKTGSSKR